jgi:hypothetical protein
VKEGEIKMSLFGLGSKYVLCLLLALSRSSFRQLR